MLRRSPRAALLWAGALAIALVTAVSVASTLASLRRQDRDFGRVRPVLVATRDLPAGTRIARGDVTARHQRGGIGSPEALRTRAEAEGRVVVVPVLRGTPVTARHVASRSRDGRDGVVPPGRRAMRLVIDDGLRPRVGDVVDVLATFDPSKVAPDVDPTLVAAAAVPVLAVDDATGGGKEKVGVTVLVDTDGAKRLAFAAANGVVALAIAPPEAAVTPDAAHPG